MLISPPAQAGTANDFVHWIAQRGDGAEIIREHAHGDDGTCRSCGRVWPCAMRRRAEESLTLQPDLPPSSGRCHTATNKITVWRGETFRGDGVRPRAEWLGRADYPDAKKARWWLALMLETLRHHSHPHAEDVFWGEVTAGEFAAEQVEDDGTVVLLGGWRPVEERGSTATAYLRGPDEPISWEEP